MSVAVGGLGGGGDVGLAAVIVDDAGLKARVGAVASFAKCSSRHVPPGLERVRGALYRVLPGASLGRRVFEDKLSEVAPWARHVYLLCVLDGWDSIVEGLEWLHDSHGVRCTIHADIGGDALMTGYEEELGSYVVDTVAKAALAHAAEKLGWKALLAVAAAGGEGGGGEISLVDLAATLDLLDNAGAILGAFAARPESLRVAEKLLAKAESGMLPLYIQAARGASKARVHMAYLSGEYPVRPWYRYILILDAFRACNASPLCRTARGRGVNAITRWSKRAALDKRAKMQYEKTRRTLQRAGESGAEKRIMRIVEKHLRKPNPLRACK